MKKIFILGLILVTVFQNVSAEINFECPNRLEKISEFDLNLDNIVGDQLKLFTGTSAVWGSSNFVLDSKHHFIKLHFKNAPIRRDMAIRSGQMLKIVDQIAEGNSIKLKVLSRYFDEVIIVDKRDATSKSMNQFFVLCR